MLTKKQQPVPFKLGEPQCTAAKIWGTHTVALAVTKMQGRRDIKGNK
jgi:hypothetical protein